jgi:hypothetical protein
VAHPQLRSDLFRMNSQEDQLFPKWLP